MVDLPENPIIPQPERESKGNCEVPKFEPPLSSRNGLAVIAGGALKERASMDGRIGNASFEARCKCGEHLRMTAETYKRMTHALVVSSTPS
jgi:hypothetical protein